MKTEIKTIGECPVCGGEKIKETLKFFINPFPSSQQIIGIGCSNSQLEERTEIKIYCKNCKVLFVE